MRSATPPSVSSATVPLGRGTIPDLVPMLEHLVVTGAWWDLVDEVAGRHVAPTHRAHPAALTPVIREWSVGDDLWLRRTAVLSQLGSKDGTDRSLLSEVIEANADRAEFWLRKAIGWALRDLSYADPDWVRAFVDAHPALSPLSRREALRRIGAAGHDPASAGARRDRSRSPG